MVMKVSNYGWLLSALTVVVAVLMAAVVMPVQSDVLELKDGTVLNGLYMGGSQSSMRFRVKDDIQVIPIEKILALTVTGRSAASTESTMSSTTPAKATGLPVGTRLLVKLMESIDTRKNKAGSRFTAQLEGKLSVDGQEIVATGSKVYGQIVTAKRGGIGKKKPVLELKLIEISINGELRPIKTNLLSGTGEGGGAGGKVLKGAAIGGLADGSSGAEDGAKIGLAVAILGGGKHAGISSGTLLEFHLAEPMNL